MGKTLPLTPTDLELYRTLFFPIYSPPSQPEPPSWLWQVFDFDDDLSSNRELRKIFKRFAFFVNAVLSRRRSRDIRKFRLRCSISDFYNFPGECVDMWVRAAIGPHLQELDLTIDCGFGAQLVLLPPSFFNCTNLVSLR